MGFTIDDLIYTYTYAVVSQSAIRQDNLGYHPMITVKSRTWPFTSLPNERSAVKYFALVPNARPFSEQSIYLLIRSPRR
jgi:hypothetical protein